jgi:hypothetical protein
MAIQEIINQKTGEHGYQVRVKGKTKYFSIKKHGGKRDTLKQAKLAEQVILKELGIKHSGERSPQEALGKRNTSGVLGIHIQWRTHRSSDNAYAYLSGSWKDKDGNPRMFGYSVDKNGLKNALRMAIAKRKASKLPVPDFDEALAILTEKLRC